MDKEQLQSNGLPKTKLLIEQMKKSKYHILLFWDMVMSNFLSNYEKFYWFLVGNNGKEVYCKFKESRT